MCRNESSSSEERNPKTQHIATYSAAPITTRLPLQGGRHDRAASPDSGRGRGMSTAMGNTPPTRRRPTNKRDIRRTKVKAPCPLTLCQRTTQTTCNPRKERSAPTSISHIHIRISTGLERTFFTDNEKFLMERRSRSSLILVVM